MTQRSTICRECGAEGDFYFKTVAANGNSGPRLLPLGMFTDANFQLRVCGNCGLTDWFVAAENLAKVREKFARKPDPLGMG